MWKHLMSMPLRRMRGAPVQEVEIANEGRKLGPKKFVEMFQGKYPNAGMTEENTVEVVRQRFPVEVPPPCLAVPWRSRSHPTRPLCHPARGLVHVAAYARGVSL